MYAYLKVEGIAGESPSEAHKDEIELEHWSWGVSNAGSAASGTGSGGSNCNVQDFHFTTKSGKHSPFFLSHCFTGIHLANAKLTLAKSGQDGTPLDYWFWTFTDVLVSSYQPTPGGGGDGLPMDSISLNFAKVESEYKPQESDGKLGGGIKAGYDLKLKNKT